MDAAAVEKDRLDGWVDFYVFRMLDKFASGERQPQFMILIICCHEGNIAEISLWYGPPYSSILLNPS